LAKHGDKVYECSQFEEKEVALAMEEEHSNSVTVVEGQKPLTIKRTRRLRLLRHPLRTAQTICCSSTPT
jgi:hypothetical protein